MRKEELLTEERWRAITANDSAYDDAFIYAVKSTGIFCRPSCKSRAPKRERVRIFQNAADARSAGFRPCKRCKPTGHALPDEEWIMQITQYIDNHYEEPLPLSVLAEIGHGSPYHLQRIFKRTTGISPNAYVQQTRVRRAKELLAGSEQPVADIAAAVGIANTPYFITLFKRLTGETPAQYRSGVRKEGAGTTAGDGFHEQIQAGRSRQS